jgi:hypothetical protein
MRLKSVFTSRRTWALVAFAVGVFSAGYVCKATQKPADGKFILDMAVPALTVPPWGVDLYVNNLVDEPARVIVKGGSRFRYEFPCRVQTVSFLRLDPVQVLDVEVAIHSLVLEVNGVLVHRFTPEELNSWSTGQPGRVENDAFYLKGVKNINHIEKSSLDVRVPLPRHLISWGELLPEEWLDRYTIVLAAMFLAALFLGLGARSYRFCLALLLLMGFLITGCYALLRHLKGTLDASAAISYSTYAGISKTGDAYVLLLLAVVPVSSAFFIWRVFLQWDKILERTWRALHREDPRP